VLVLLRPPGGQGGELPFVTGTQTNGDLLSHSIFN